MTYLQLKSTNPNFSYILKKNPASGMLIKDARRGRLFAWYTDTQTFNIYFRDSDTEVSYGKGDSKFEYMDETRYNAPMFLVNAFSQFLNHMKKADEKDIPGYENILIINMIKCKSRSLDGFKSNFVDYEFNFEELTPHNYRITIKTKKTLLELISIGNIVSIFNSLLNDDIEATSDYDVEKYMNWIRIVDAPYYIRHLFSIYFLNSEKLFNKYKPLLEMTGKENLKYEFEIGSNIKQRIRAVKNRIEFKSSNFIDVGCGEGEYVREFAPRLNEDMEYHAIDTNAVQCEKVKRMCERKEIDNVAIWTSLDEFYIGTLCSLANSNFLITEVIEHMTKEEAVGLITKILQKPHHKIFITTPNKDFNTNYMLFNEEVRNDGHKFEMTKNEFRNFIIDICEKFQVSLDFFGIGDKVNGLQPTLGVIIK